MRRCASRTCGVPAAALMLLFCLSGRALAQRPSCRNIDIGHDPEQPRPAASLPVLLHGTAPRYPRSVLHAAKAGYVRVQYSVWCDGTVPLTSIRVMSASDSALIKPVVASLRKRRYRPSLVGSKPVARVFEEMFRVGGAGREPRRASGSQAG